MIRKKKLDAIVHSALNDESWTLSNNILYEMCKQYPSNKDKEPVLAKTLIIGRVYSAALERGVGKKKTRGGKFYIENVFPKISSFFSDPEIKKFLGSLKIAKDYSDAIEVHGRLVKALHGLRKSNKISFVSKYLHFHYPDQFYIYDSRAKKAIGILNHHYNEGKKLSKKSKIISGEEANTDYLNYVSKCEILKKALENKLKRELTIRQFDTILINIADAVT